jgi:hypothetical protein
MAVLLADSNGATTMSKPSNTDVPKTNSDIREISGDELASVTGGLKWDRNHASPNVIDMRGGQKRVGLFVIASYDIDGNVSGYDHYHPCRS